jgi:hypothetical protein
MNREPTTTRAVRSWLQDGVTRLPDRVLDGVLDEVAATPQRRRPWSTRLLLGVSFAAAVVAAAAIVGSGLLPSTRTTVAPPTDATLAPRISSPLDQGALDAGTHTIEGVFDADVAFTVPAGWSVGDVGVDHVEIVKVPPDQPVRALDGMGVGYFLIDNLFFDPCAPDDRTIEPSIGPTVDDLAQGFANVAGYRASAPVATTIDGYRGLRVDLDPVLYMCPISDAHLWTTPAGWIQSVRREEERNMLWILDVDGVRLVIDAYTVRGAANDDPSELEAIVESIRIQP